jgi:hypothetical protein
MDKYQKIISNILETQNRMANELDEIKKNIGGNLKITGLKNLEERIAYLEAIVNEIVVFEDELEEVAHDYLDKSKKSEFINAVGDNDVLDVLKSLRSKIGKTDLKPISFPNDFYQYGQKTDGIKVSDEEINEIVNLVREVGIGYKEFIHLGKGDMAVFAFHDGTTVRYIVAKDYYEYIQY